MKSRALTKRSKCKCYTKNGEITWPLTRAQPRSIYGRRQTFRFLKLLETILIRIVLGEKVHIVKITTTTTKKSVLFVRLTLTEFHARRYEINTLTMFNPTIATWDCFFLKSPYNFRKDSSKGLLEGIEWRICNYATHITIPLADSAKQNNRRTATCHRQTSFQCMQSCKVCHVT